MKKIPLICVVGPTASGKTTLGVNLCKELDGEVIGADSMQIYRSMPIASAVPTTEERQGVPHHLIEFLDFSVNFSVADYVSVAHEKIKEVYGRKKQPIVVGGTGLYINSLVDNIQFVDEPTDLELRKALNFELAEKGQDFMHQKLALIDEKAAARLHPNNTRRIVRALELFALTGKTMTELEAESRSVPTPYETVLVGITYENRELLYERIRRRVDLMLESGLLKEAEATFNLKGGGIQAIGHKELHKYFGGELEFTEAVELLKRESCHYAKRQLTWFKKDQRINWIYADKTDDVLGDALKIIKEAQEKSERQ